MKYFANRQSDMLMVPLKVRINILKVIKRSWTVQTNLLIHRIARHVQLAPRGGLYLLAVENIAIATRSTLSGGFWPPVSIWVDPGLRRPPRSCNVSRCERLIRGWTQRISAEPLRSFYSWSNPIKQFIFVYIIWEKNKLYFIFAPSGRSWKLY